MKLQEIMNRKGKTRLAMAFIAGAFSLGTLQAAELTFWSWRVEDKAFYEKVARDYKKISGDDVKFQAYKNTDYPAVLSTALASGGGPDIIHTRAYGGLSNLSDANYLLELTSNSVPNLRAFNSQTLEGSRGFKDPYNQKIYGVPFATQSLGIFYNRALLTKAGIKDVPKTWDEFKLALSTLKAAGITPLANGSKEAPILEQMFGVVGPNFYGGTPFFDAVRSGQKNFTDAGFVKAIEEVVSLKDFMPTNAMGIGENEARTLFALGSAAFFMTGSWNIETLKEINPKLEFSFMAAPPLTAGGKSWVSTFADGNYSINANTKNREAALKFVNYLGSREFGQELTKELRQNTAVPGVKTADPLLTSVTTATNNGGTPFIMLVGFRYQNPNGSVMLRDGIQKVMQGRGTPASLAIEIQDGISTWFKPAKK
jgi:raffinose/stachyose/melibiose transport system substrate-binding protein